MVMAAVSRWGLVKPDSVNVGGWGWLRVVGMFAEHDIRCIPISTTYK